MQSVDILTRLDTCIFLQFYVTHAEGLFIFEYF